MEIAEVGEAVLGPKLIGFQVGNEPDLYAAYVLFDSPSFFLHVIWRLFHSFPESRTS